LALKNPAAVDAGLPERIGPVRSIAHQSPGFREDTIDVDRRHTVSHRQHRNLDAALDEQISWSDYQAPRLLLHDTGEGRLNGAAGTGVEDIDLQPKSRRRLLRTRNHVHDTIHCRQMQRVAASCFQCCGPVCKTDVDVRRIGDAAMSYDRNRQNEINLAKARADLAHANGEIARLTAELTELRERGHVRFAHGGWVWAERDRRSAQAPNMTHQQTS